MSLSEEQIERYSRQIILPEVGGRGQEMLLRSAVALVGAGALARVAALYVAAAGAGRLNIYGTGSSAEARCLCAEIADLNPDVVSRAHGFEGALRGEHDIILDASGDRDTRALLNAEALRRHRPLISGGMAGCGGWVAVFRTDTCGRPCAGCVPFDVDTLSDDAQPALGPAVSGVIGSVLALEWIKLRLGVGEPLEGILHYDAVRTTFERQALARVADCPACGGA